MGIHKTSYTNCLASENFEYIPKQDPQDPFELKYKLVSDLLFIYKVHYRIYIPPSLTLVILTLNVFSVESL